MAQGKGILRRSIENFLDTYGFGEKFGKWFRNNSEVHNNSLGEAYKQFVDEFGIRDEMPEFLKPGSPPAVVGGIVAIIPMVLGMLAGAGLSIGIGIMSPYVQSWSYKVADKARQWRPDPLLLQQMMHRRPDERNYLLGIENDLGVPTRISKMLDDVSRPKLGAREVLSLLLRGEYSRGQAEDYLSLLGWDDLDIKNLVNLAQIIPPPQDLISMAVREAFNDDVAARFKYDENFPSEFGEWTEKQGLSSDWAKRYWRAHWRLPSVNQVFEMFQRLRPNTGNVTVDEDDVNTYLQTADISPFWRDRLKKISYRTLTRVDVRRMYRLLGWSREQLVDKYKDLGYNDEDADNLAEFTILFETQDDVELTRDAITTGYRRRIIGREEALGSLQTLGYKLATAEFYLAIEDSKENERIISDELKRIERLYITGEIDDVSVHDELGSLDLAATQVERMLSTWSVKKKAQERIPTLSELETWYKQEMITVDDYRTGLLRRNISPDYLDVYIASTDFEIGEKRGKELERAQKEEERIKKAKLTNAYQKDRASLDVNIAEVKVAISDMKVALFLAENDDSKLVLGERILLLQSVLAGINLQKATLKSDLEELV